MAILWWLGSLAAWLSSIWSLEGVMLGSSAAERSGPGAVATSAIMILLISATLRLPAITAPDNDSRVQSQMVWLLCLGANVNWLGMVCLVSEWLWSCLPLAILGLALEIWLFGHYASKGGSFLFLSGHSPLDPREKSAALAPTGSGENSNPVDSQSSHKWPLVGECPRSEQPISTPAHSISELSRNPEWEGQEPGRAAIRNEPASKLGDLAGADGSANGWKTLRTMVDQIDDGGRRFLSGEIFVSWQPGQRHQQFVVGFVPAFRSPPKIVFETESPETIARCLNCTETGMRVELKRAEPLNAAHASLAWCASEAHEDSSEPIPRSTPAPGLRLP